MVKESMCTLVNAALLRLQWWPMMGGCMVKEAEIEGGYKVEVIGGDQRDEALRAYVVPNTTNNRFDAFYQGDYVLYRCGGTYLPYHRKHYSADIAMYLRDVDKGELRAILAEIFRTEKSLFYVDVVHAAMPIDGLKKVDHWHVELPATIEEFQAALGKKTRYNSKWYPKKIRKDLGDYTCEAVDHVSDEHVQVFFKFKKATHGVDYHDEPREFIRKNLITHAYVFKLGGVIEAIALSSELGERAYLYNITYNPAHSKYSIGNVLYFFYISELIAKRITRLDLRGGNQLYKKLFNGIATDTYSGRVYAFHPRNRILGYLKKISIKVRRALPFGKYAKRKR